MAEPIKIIITQGGEGGEGLGSTSTPKGRDTKFGTEGQDLLDNLGLSKKEQMALAGIAIAAARKSIMNSINNTANMTGNYMKATKINEAVNLATKVGGMTLAAYTAVSVMSPTGAALAIGAMVISEGMSIQQSLREFEIRTSKINYQAERARVRAGTSLGDGSRGTNG